MMANGRIEGRGCVGYTESSVSKSSIMLFAQFDLICMFAACLGKVVKRKMNIFHII